MAINLVTFAPTFTSPQPPHLHLHLHHKTLTLSPPPLSMFTNNRFTGLRTRKRGELAVAKAGPPSSTSLILAFVLPLSLLAGTVFASVRVADQLDEKFLEDLAMNRALMEENEEGEEDEGGESETLAGEDGNIVLEEEAAAAAAAAAVPRVRNRPRREA